MQLRAVFAAIAVVVLGGCLGPEGAPTATGSVSPTVAMGDAVGPAANPVVKPKRSLADAVTLCLDRKVPVQPSQFRSCVTKAQRATAPRAEVTLTDESPPRERGQRELGR